MNGKKIQVIGQSHINVYRNILAQAINISAWESKIEKEERFWMVTLERLALGRDGILHHWKPYHEKGTMKQMFGFSSFQEAFDMTAEHIGVKPTCHQPIEE